MELNRSEESLIIGFGGDTMIGRLVADNLNKVSPEYLWGDVLPLLQATDINILNLEAALTKSTEEVYKVFNFKADPSHVEVLRWADCVNLANNHVLDYGVPGLLETLETLDQASIRHVGAGKTLEGAQEPVILERGGVSLGLLGFTDNEPTWCATKERPGTWYVKVGDIEAVKPKIESLRQKVDILIVTLHWGPNMRPEPTKLFVEFAHSLCDLGVDIIHGHSAHIFQGIEVYKGKLILYDTGDFVDDYYVDPILRNDRSFFFLVEIDKSGVRGVQLIPTLISSFQVNVAQGEEYQAAVDRMRLISKVLGSELSEQDAGYLPFKSLGLHL